MTKKASKSRKESKPRVHKELEGFEISVDQFGEIKSNMNIEKINEFLNENVEDKKLQERPDYEEIRKPKKNKKK
jgi:hypothetical protein